MFTYIMSFVIPKPCGSSGKRFDFFIIDIISDAFAEEEWYGDLGLLNKAAELLGKRYALFTDKVETDVDMDLNITIDYGDNDNEES